MLVPDDSITDIEAVGTAFTVIVVEAVATQPFKVTVTVYVVVAVGLTLMEVVVEPPDQE